MIVCSPLTSKLYQSYIIIKYNWNKIAIIINDQNSSRRNDNNMLDDGIIRIDIDDTNDFKDW